MSTYETIRSWIFEHPVLWMAGLFGVWLFFRIVYSVVDGRAYRRKLAQINARAVETAKEWDSLIERTTNRVAVPETPQIDPRRYAALDVDFDSRYLTGGHSDAEWIADQFKAGALHRAREIAKRAAPYNPAGRPILHTQTMKASQYRAMQDMPIIFDGRCSKCQAVVNAWGVCDCDFDGRPTPGGAV